MNVPETWSRLTSRVPSLQTDQAVIVPWVIPAAITAGAFGITWFRVQFALPLLIVATALDRYRFDVAGAGLRIEHFVLVGVALVWLLRTRPTFRRFGFSRADLLLVAYLCVALLASFLFAPLLRESLKFLALMVFGVALYLAGARDGKRGTRIHTRDGDPHRGRGGGVTVWDCGLGCLSARS